MIAHTDQPITASAVALSRSQWGRKGVWSKGTRVGLQRPEILRRHYFRPQHSYICLPGSQTPEVDYIGHMESLDQAQEALALAQESMNVAILDIEEDAALRVADELKTLGVRALGRHCDVTQPASLESA